MLDFTYNVAPPIHTVLRTTLWAELKLIIPTLYQEPPGTKYLVRTQI